MSRIIPQRHLRNENAKVIDAVTAGKTFVITRNGGPVEKLRPNRPRRRTLIARDGVTELACGAERIDHRRFRDCLDQVIDQDL